MGFMYGNSFIHQPRTNFTFTEVFPNRAAMQRKAEEITSDDPKYEEYVDIGAYVLIDYNKINSDGGGYSENWAIDQDKYKNADPTVTANNNFDLTVWQVQLVNEKAKCIAIARLHSVLPTFEVCGNYQIDILESTSEGNYFGRGKNIFTLDSITDIPITT